MNVTQLNKRFIKVIQTFPQNTTQFAFFQIDLGILKDVCS